MLTLLLKGFVIGFAIAAPVGPIGVLCIQHALQDGFKVGLMTGLGAALGDGTYGLTAGLGLTATSSLLLLYQNWIRLIGGLFLLYLGIKILLATPRERSVSHQSDKSPWHACMTTYFLTLTNPMTILSFIAIFTGLGLGSPTTNYLDFLFLVTGIIIGSASWWLFLTGSVAYLFHKQISLLSMRIINWTSGSIILVLGITSIATAITH